MNEDRLSTLLHDRPVPGEDAARERSLRMVRAAFAEREVAPRRTRPARALVALAAALVLLASAFTPPGQAVTDWVRDVVEPGREDAREALVSLPAHGRLLVVSSRGPWIVQRDGSKRLLGPYEDASWSPGGLFVVASRGTELAALDPKGEVRWSLARSDRVRGARWSPDGFRIAYTSGNALRVVAGDGTGDRVLDMSVTSTAPAWRPGAKHELAFVDGDGAVRLAQTDSGRRIWRAATAEAPAQLAWSADGTRLLTLAPDRISLFDARGRLLTSVPMPGGSRAVSAAFAPAGHAFALSAYSGQEGRSRLTLVRPARDETTQRLLLSGAGRFGEIAWSPDGRWLVGEWPDADQWVFIRVRPGGLEGIQRLTAVANIADQFDPGARTRKFPQIQGWCCLP